VEPKKKWTCLIYTRVIKDLNKKKKQTLFIWYRRIPKFDLDKTIVDLDIRESGIRFGKRSFINCEVTLFLDTQTWV
jgi:hypothetical protein